MIFTKKHLKPVVLSIDFIYRQFLRDRGAIQGSAATAWRWMSKLAGILFQIPCPFRT